MRALVQRLSVVFALLLLALAAPAASAAPAVDGISARAVDASGKSIGSAYFVQRSPAGSTFEQHIAISNSGKRFARLYIDAVDAVTSDRGGTVFSPRDAPDKSVGAWITPSKKLIRLDPGDEKIVSFSVAVPADAFAGDHVGGIAVEPLRRQTTGGQFSVTQVLRVAIATQIKVPGDTRRLLVPKVLRLEAIRGSEIPALYVRLNNAGDRLCKPTLTATLYKDKQVLSSEKRDVDTILARTSIDYPLYWSNGLKRGKYTAAIRTENCGKFAESQAEVELKTDLSGTTPPATTGLAPEPPTAPMETWLKIVIGLGSALLLLALGWWLARRSNRRGRERERELERRERELEERERAANPAAPSTPQAPPGPPTP